MEFRRCENCAYFRAAGLDGECRAGPPSMPTLSTTARWPAVGRDEWCGWFQFDGGRAAAELQALRVRAFDLTLENESLRRDMSATQALCDAARAELNQPEVGP